MSSIPALRHLRASHKQEIAATSELVNQLSDARTAQTIRVIIEEKLRALAIDIRLTKGEPNSEYKSISVLVKEDLSKQLKGLLEKLGPIIDNLKVDDVD